MDNIRKEEIKKELQKLYQRLLIEILQGGVRKQNSIEEIELSTKEMYEEFIYGVQITFLYSYFEGYFGKIDQNMLVNINKEKLKNSLIIFKYIRDVLAHNYRGELFPSDQANTIEFNSIRHAENIFDIETSNMDNDKEYIVNKGPLVTKAKELIFSYIDNCL